MIYSDGQNVIKGAWASRPHSKLDRRQKDLSVLSRREFESQPLQTQSLRKGLSLNVKELLHTLERQGLVISTSELRPLLELL